MKGAREGEKEKSAELMQLAAPGTPARRTGVKSSPPPTLDTALRDVGRIEAAVAYEAFDHAGSARRCGRRPLARSVRHDNDFSGADG